MKRSEKSIKESKPGIVISLSDVYEVEFKYSTAFHKAGEKKLVSLPIAHKFWKQGKVSLKGEVLSKVEELDKKMK